MNYNVRNASNLILWLDGDDSATMLSTIGGTGAADSGTVAEWVDKSGNGNDATNNTAANLPIRDDSGSGIIESKALPGLEGGSTIKPRNVPSGLYFSTDFLTCGTALGDPSAYTIYLVYTPGASVSGAYVICGGASSGSALDNWGLISNELWGTGGDGKVSHTFGDGTLYRYEEPASQHTYSYHPTIYSVAKTAGTGASVILERGNTLSYSTGGTSAVNASTTGATFSLGRYPGTTSSYMSGWIHELIVCESAHDLMEQQEINGYLAYKYNFIARKGFVQVPKVVAKAGTGNSLKVNFPAVTENRMEAGLTSIAAKIKVPDGSMADLSGSISDIGNGVYEFTLDGTEVNAQGGGSVVIKHALIDDVFIPLEIEDGAAVWNGAAEDTYGVTTMGGYLDAIKKFCCNKIVKSGGTATVYKDDEATTYTTVDISASTRDPA